MSGISAETAAIHAYGGRAATMAADLAAAGAGAAAAGPILLGPVFGLIGGDFVAAFGTAHAAHVDSIGKLSGVLGSMSAAAVASALAYDDTDATGAVALRATGAGIESST